MERWPFEVFLSFKHGDAERRRTRDAELATEVYDYLSARGLRVFFSAESLREDGVAAFQQEVYAALESCRVLIVVGTSRERLESPWVRHEWHTFLSEILNNSKPHGRIFSYVEGITLAELPIALRNSQSFSHEEHQLHELYQFTRNALAAPSTGASAASSPAVPARARSHSDIETLMSRYCWVSYDPCTFSPETNPSPDEAEIDRELGWVRAAGFKGIVTYGARGTLGLIPKIAKRHDLRVIMGIWSLTPEAGEVDAAIAATDHADGYCVGHRGLGRRYSFDELDMAIRTLRERTGRPTTTTEAAHYYRIDRRLLDLGDWLFPDMQLKLRDDLTEPDSFDVKRDVRQFIDRARAMSELAIEPSRPLVSKMTFYPHDGAPGASRENQALFFQHLYDAIRDAEHTFQHRVSFVFHSAFDCPWKSIRPFAPWDRYTGLLDNGGAPHPAARDIVWSFGASSVR
jgi:hypothetical protein